jgi:hypothetical protein
LPALSRPRIRMRISLVDQRRREKMERAPPIVLCVVFVVVEFVRVCAGGLGGW